jgi:hypothetical protein
MHSLQSPVYNETLARRGLPPRFFKVLSHVYEQGDHTSEIALHTYLHTLWPHDSFGGGFLPSKPDVW